MPVHFSAILHFPTCSCDWDLELACFGFYLLILVLLFNIWLSVKWEVEVPVTTTGRKIQITQLIAEKWTGLILLLFRVDMISTNLDDMIEFVLKKMDPKPTIHSFENSHNFVLIWQLAVVLIKTAISVSVLYWPIFWSYPSM